MSTWLTTGLVLALFLVSSFTIVGLLALWATTSSRHWLWRWVTVLGVLSPLLLIPAYEPWIVFALQLSTVVISVQVSQRWTAWRENRLASGDDDAPSKHRLRFSLGTLLAVTPLVAVLTAIATRMATNWPEQTVESWTTVFLNGAGSGCAVILGAWMYTSRRKWIAGPVGLTLCLGLAAVMARYDWLYWSITVYPGWPPASPSPASPFQREFGTAWFAILPAVTAVTWLLVSLWFAGAVSSTSIASASGTVSPRPKLQQIALRCLFLLALLAVAIPPTAVTWQLLHPEPIPNIPAPASNGLDDILAAGESFERSSILTSYAEPGSTEALAAEITKYAHAYERFRVGLTQRTQARVWRQDGNLDPSSDNILTARSVARALRSEAELAQQQDRYSDAARIAVDNIRLAHAISRDGLLVDHLIGIAIEGMGHDSLCDALHQLNANDCRETISTLADIDRGREPLDEVLRRERIWMENAHGWFGHFCLLLDDVVSSEALPWHAALARKRGEAATRLLIVELAVRAFQLHRGDLPDQLEELTPEVLADLPVDPFDPQGLPLRYLRTNDGYVLYSIGADGDDDGGRPLAEDESGWWDPRGDGDLRLDQLFAPDADTDEGDTEPSE
jgi:hypothetical protein